MPRVAKSANRHKADVRKRSHVVSKQRGGSGTRPAWTLGHKDLSGRCSEIDHHPSSRFPCEDFGSQDRYILESRP
jgi:hypothetical protein